MPNYHHLDHDSEQQPRTLARARPKRDRTISIIMISSITINIIIIIIVIIIISSSSSILSSLSLLLVVDPHIRSRVGLPFGFELKGCLKEVLTKNETFRISEGRL